MVCWGLRTVSLSMSHTQQANSSSSHHPLPSCLSFVAHKALVHVLQEAMKNQAVCACTSIFMRLWENGRPGQAAYALFRAHLPLQHGTKAFLCPAFVVSLILSPSFCLLSPHPAPCGHFHVKEVDLGLYSAYSVLFTASWKSGILLCFKNTSSFRLIIKVGHFP